MRQNPKQVTQKLLLICDHNHKTGTDIMGIVVVIKERFRTFS